MSHEELEMIQDFQDWAVEYEGDEPGKENIVSNELLQFYVKSYIDELAKDKAFNGGNMSSFQLNWGQFVEYSKSLSGGAAIFEHVNMKTIQGVKLKMHIERAYQDYCINRMISEYKNKTQ